MKSFFDARKIAVIGASRDRSKVGRAIFENLLVNPNLKVFPINPKASELSGVKCYPDVLSVPFLLDMAIIAIPAEKVPDVLEECGRKEIKNVVVISAGFAESGNQELSDKMKNVVERYGLRLIGPNVLGIINPYKNLNASFFRDMPLRGQVAFISQSGAVGTALLDRAVQENLGISGFVSLGNMLQQDFIDALDYFGNDMRTGIIVLYIEGLRQKTGRKFIEICKKIGPKKKIIAIKSGKSGKGLKAAKTHTASLSSDSAIYSGAFKQAGIIEVESLEDLFMVAKILSKYGKIGRKAGIITNAGGLGVLSVDSCINNGLEVPRLTDRILNQLDDFLPKGYGKGNPLDILGDALAERYEKVLRVLAREGIFDFFIVIVSPQEMTQPLETARVLGSTNRPVFACFVGGKSFELAKKELLEMGVVNFNDVNDAGRVLGKIAG